MTDTEYSASGITLREVYAARRTIAPWVRRTPLKLSRALSNFTGATVHLKLETVRDTGAFKIRGATNRIRNLSDEERAGVGIGSCY